MIFLLPLDIKWLIISVSVNLKFCNLVHEYHYKYNAEFKCFVDFRVCIVCLRAEIKFLSVM